ncbi:MAG: carbohydrate-binding protein [Verrucomicrobiia bacterium]|jgi:hypothetical protein
MKNLLIAIAACSLVSAQAGDKGGTKPYNGKVHSIPGLIEAEHWDLGKAGVAYADADEKNRGAAYREPTGVDIEKRSDASNGHGVGWTREGEWLVYTVNVKESGTYRIEIPVASKKPGGDFHIAMDGKDVTGPITVPDTGSWQKLETVVHKNVKLKKGHYLMKVSMDKKGPSNSIADIDCYKFIKE